MTTNQTIDGVPRELPAKWTDKYGAEYRLCPVVGCLQIQIREAGRPDKWIDVKMTPAHALIHLIPAAQPQGVLVSLKEAYEEGFSDGSRAGDDQYNWKGFRDELAKAWPVSDACKLYAEQPAPVAVRMCDCNQGRMPCNGKCAPTI